MCQMVLEICPLCKFCGPLHRPYMKIRHSLEPCSNAATAGPCRNPPEVDRQGEDVCRRCINLANEKKKQDEKKKKDDDKKKDKDKRAQDKVVKAARMKAWSKSNKAENDAIKKL
ncbi:hypothetical protein J4E93_010310 [Alternaria ventricosa]|uniref:uncharacterized protein n=1 Tax=Alternaria ventricosa TaxID=1187951 RepID=UPI0020C53F71|nr:uncharacterized protein J4E93_010310 [Alternaria ventricosa]KAI4638309.1 hypothetical protein J4E93_010310 [Alternaria ventricosa]